MPITQARAARNPALDNTLARNTATVLGGTLLLALCAHIALPLPFTPVPVTMQTFAVLLLGMALSPSLSALTLVAYLAEGAIGLPVFAAGPGSLFAPPSGSLLAFVLAAPVAGLIYRALSRHLPSLASALVAGIVASLPIFLIGAAWFALFLHPPVHSILPLAVTPFLPGEAVKLTLAALVVSSLHRLRRAR